MLPAIATAPITFVIPADDEKKIPARTIMYVKGDYVHPEDHALLKDSHAYALSPVAHSEHVCPPTCKDDSHKPATPQRTIPSASATAVVLPPAPSVSVAPTDEVKS